MAGLRLAGAVQLLVLLPVLPFLPWVGLSEVALVTPVALGLAAPLLPFHAVICRKEAPHLSWGYGVVVAYGPLLLLIAIGLGLRSESIFVLGFIAYELAALVAIILYIGLWKLGDAWFGDMVHPRAGRRWILAAGLSGVLCLWGPYMAWVEFADRCADRGGGRDGWTCRIVP